MTLGVNTFKIDLTGNNLKQKTKNSSVIPQQLTNHVQTAAVSTTLARAKYKRSRCHSFHKESVKGRTVQCWRELLLQGPYVQSIDQMSLPYFLLIKLYYPSLLPWLKDLVTLLEMDDCVLLVKLSFPHLCSF